MSNTMKIQNNATETVKQLFTKIYGFEPLNVVNNGTYYWADQVGFSLIGKYVIKNELYNGK
jgi:hypothetical protein